MHGAPQPEKLDAHSRTHLITRRQGIASATAAVLTVLSGPFATAEPVKLEQPYTDKRPFSVQIKVQSSGHLFTSRSGGQSERHTMTAAATYEFIERRLPPGGRDAQALRAVRDFQTARMEMLVSDKRTTSELLPMERVIVSSGQLEGVSAYSPTTLLSRDSLDLLELPADPLILTALLPAVGCAVRKCHRVPNTPDVRRYPPCLPSPRPTRGVACLQPMPDALRAAARRG